jgi:hypothetical protein
MDRSDAWRLADITHGVPPESGADLSAVSADDLLLRVVRYEHRTSLLMDIGQSDGPDRNLWAMFIMTR